MPSQLAVGEKCVKPIKRRDTDIDVLAKINVIAELLLKDGFEFCLSYLWVCICFYTN